MDVGSRTVQGRALGDAPSSECPHHLILQQPADLQEGQSRKWQRALPLLTGASPHS